MPFWWERILIKLLQWLRSCQMIIILHKNLKLGTSRDKKVRLMENKVNKRWPSVRMKMKRVLWKVLGKSWRQISLVMLMNRSRVECNYRFWKIIWNHQTATFLLLEAIRSHQNRYLKKKNACWPCKKDVFSLKYFLTTKQMWMKKSSVISSIKS